VAGQRTQDLARMKDGSIHCRRDRARRKPVRNSAASSSQAKPPQHVDEFVDVDDPAP
jgi:hypothetical protein